MIVVCTNEKIQLYKYRYKQIYFSHDLFFFCTLEKSVIYIKNAPRVHFDKFFVDFYVHSSEENIKACFHLYSFVFNCTIKKPSFVTDILQTGVYLYVCMFVRIPSPSLILTSIKALKRDLIIEQNA